MKKRGRYTASGLVENQFMPGSDNTVLLNLCGITSTEELERMETELLFDVSDQLLDEFDREHQFTSEDIKNIHYRWLNAVYEWAGKYRQVMMSKGGFMFAAPAYIPDLMVDFERKVLSKTTPCNFADRNKVVEALALVHTELILIHPFREGNGRLSRLLATLMALQADLPLLDFSGLEKEQKQEYFAAVQHGMERNYRPMEKIFSDVIVRSLQGAD